MRIRDWLLTKTGSVDVIKKLAHRLGLEVTVLSAHEMPPHYAQIFETVRPFTMTSLARIYSVISAVEHVCRNAVPGAIVECGVWRGGSTMAALLALKNAGDTARDVFLYDTFEGMVQPGEKDGKNEKEMHAMFAREDGGSDWCRAGMTEVSANLGRCGYPMERVHLVQGRVEQTIPGGCPEQIAVLRLDTDWYESTRHELEHLFPRLARGGVLIIDDYGSWEGAKKAVDEYLVAQDIRSFLHRIDSTGRLLIKE